MENNFDYINQGPTDPGQPVGKPVTAPTGNNPIEFSFNAGKVTDPQTLRNYNDYYKQTSQFRGPRYSKYDASGAPFKEPGSYDNYLGVDDVQAYVRGNNQHWSAQAFNGIINMTPSIGTKFLGMGASILGGIYGGVSGEGIVKKGVDNPMSDALNIFSDYMKNEVLPVYGSKNYLTGNAIDKLGTTSWLFNDFADGAAYAIQAFGTGKVIGSLIGEGILSAALARGTLSKNVIKAAASEFALSAVSNTKDVLGIGTRHLVTGAVNTFFEASSEAHEAKTKVDGYYDALVQKAKMEGRSESEIERIKQDGEIAADSAVGSVFNSNAMLLMFTNTLLEAKWSLKPASALATSTERAILGKVLAGEGIEGLAESLVKKKSMLKAFGKGVLGEAYVEENVQAAIQDRFFQKYTDPKHKGDSSLEDVGEIFGESLLNAAAFTSNIMAGLVRGLTRNNVKLSGLETEAGSKQDEASQAMFAALGIAGVMNPISAAKEYKAEMEAAKKYGEGAEKIFKGRKLADLHAVDNMRTVLKTFKYDQVQEDGTTVTRETHVNPDTGKPEVDLDKLVLMHRRITNIMQKHMNALDFLSTNDQTSYDINKDQSLWEYAYDLYSMTKDTGRLQPHEVDALIDSIPQLNDQIMSEINEDGLLKDNKKKIRSYYDQIAQVTNKHTKISDSYASIFNIKDANKRRDIEDDINIRNDMARTEAFLTHKRESLLDNVEELSGYRNDKTVNKDVLDRLPTESLKSRYQDLVDYNHSLADLDKKNSITKRMISDQVKLKNKLAYEKQGINDRAKELEQSIRDAKTEEDRVALQKDQDSILKEGNVNAFKQQEAELIDGTHYVKQKQEFEINGQKIEVETPQYSISDQPLRKVGSQRLYSDKYRAENKISENSIRGTTDAKLLVDRVIQDKINDIKEKYKSNPIISSLLNKGTSSRFSFAIDLSKISPEEIKNLLQDLENIVDIVDSVGIGNEDLLEISKNLIGLYNNLKSTQGIRDLLAEDINDVVIPDIEEALDTYNKEIAQNFEPVQALADLVNGVDSALRYFIETTDKILNDTSTSEDIKSDLSAEIFNVYNNIIQGIANANTQGIINLGIPSDEFIRMSEYIDPSHLVANLDAFTTIASIINAQSLAVVDVIKDSLSQYTDKVIEYGQLINKLDNFISNRLNPYKIEQDLSELVEIERDPDGYNKKQALDQIVKTPRVFVETYFDNKGQLIPEQVKGLESPEYIQELMKQVAKAYYAYEVRDDVSDSAREDALKMLNVLANALGKLEHEAKKNEINLDRKNQQYLDYKISVLMDTFKIDAAGNLTTAVGQYLQSVLASSGIDFKAELQYQLSKNNLANLSGLLASINAKLTAEQKTTLLSKIKEDQESRIQEVLAKHTKSFHKGATISGALKNLALNPSFYARYIFNTQWNLFSDRKGQVSEIAEIRKNPEGAVFQITEHNNFLEALNSLPSDNLLTPEEKKNIEIFVQDIIKPFQGLYDLQMHLTSNYVFTDLQKTLEDVVSKKGIKLSQQQFATTMDLLTFLFNTSNNNSTNLNNAAILPGVLGSGKSTIAAIALEIYNSLSSKTSIDHMLITGHAETSSEAFNKKMDPTSTEKRPIDQITEADLVGKEILVIDEAFVISSSELIRVSKMVENYNITNNKYIKIVFIGDMSQNRASEQHLLTEVLINDPIQGMYKGIGATIISPLATIYRSNIASIVSAIYQFKDKLGNIPAISTTASIKNISEYSPEALGVIGTGSMDINRFLLGRDTSRSALLIVNTRAQALHIISEITKSGKTLTDLNLRVHSYLDAGSLTSDEAYVFIDRNAATDSADNFTDKTFNTAMYTAVGRAAKLVIIGEMTKVAVNTTVSSIDDTIELSEGILRNLRLSYNSILNGFQDAAERYFQAEKKERSTEATPENINTQSPIDPMLAAMFNEPEDLDELGNLIPLTLDVIALEPMIANPSIDKLGTHNDKYSKIKELNNQAIIKVMAGRTDSNEKVKAVFATRNKRDTNGANIRLVSLFAPDIHGLYHEIAVLTSEELKGEYNFLDEKALSTQGLVTIRKDLTIEDLQPHIIHETELSYIRRANYNNTGAEVETAFTTLMTTWANGFYGSDWENQIPESMYNKNTKEFSWKRDHFQVSVLTEALFTKLDLVNRGFSKGIMGLPILQIKDYNKNQGKPTPQFIILSSKPAHEVEGWYEKAIIPIRESLEDVTNLERFLEGLASKREADAQNLYLGDNKLVMNTDLIDAFVRRAYTYGDVKLKDNHLDILKEVLKNPNLSFIQGGNDTQTLTNEELNELERLIIAVADRFYTTANNSQLVIKESEFQELKDSYGPTYTFRAAKGRDGKTGFTSKVTGETYIRVELADSNGTYQAFKPNKKSLGYSSTQKAFDTFARPFGSRNFGESESGGYKLNTFRSYTTREGEQKTQVQFPKTVFSLRKGGDNNGWRGRIRYLMRWIILDDPRATEETEKYDKHTPDSNTVDLTAVKEAFKKYNYNNPDRTPIGNDDLFEMFETMFPQEYNDLLEHVSNETNVPITSHLLNQIAKTKQGEPVTDTKGESVRAHIGTNVGNTDLSNPEARSRLEKATTNKFVKFTQNAVSIDLSMSKGKSLEDYLDEEVRDKEDSFQQIPLEELKDKLFLSEEETPLRELFLKNLGNPKIIVVPRLKDNSAVYINSKGEVIMALGSTTIKPRLFTHEILHTMFKSIVTEVDNDRGTKEEKLFIKRLTAIQAAFDEQLKLDKINPRDIYEYTLSKLDLNEFIANFSNSKFISKLQEMKKGKSNLLKSLIKAIVDFLFKDSTHDNLYDLAKQSFEDFLTLHVDEVGVNPKEEKGNTILDKYKQVYKTKIDKLEIAEELNKLSDEVLEKVQNLLARLKKEITAYEADPSIGTTNMDTIIGIMENSYSWSTDKEQGTSQPVDEYFSGKISSKYQLAKLFKSDAAANSAIFNVKKYLYEALHASGSVNNYQVAARIAFGNIQQYNAQLAEDFKKEFEAKKIPHQGEISAAMIDPLLISLRRELISYTGDEESLDYLAIEGHMHALTDLKQKYKYDIDAMSILASNIENFGKVINYTFKNWNKFENSEYDEDVEDGKGNLKSSIQKNEETNIMDSFSTEVKNYLSLIPVRNEDGEIVKFVYPKSAIVQIGKLFQEDIDFFTLDNTTLLAGQLEAAKRDRLYGPSELAVLSRIQDTLSTYSSDLTIREVLDDKGVISETIHESNLPKTKSVFVDFFENSKDAMNPRVWYIEALDPNIEIKGMGPKEAKINFGDKVKITEYRNIDTLLADTSKSVKDLEIIKKLYNKHKAFNDLTNLRTYLGSLQEVTYMQAITEYDFKTGTRSSSYTKIAPQTALNKSKTRLASQILDLYSGVPYKAVHGTTRITEFFGNSVDKPSVYSYILRDLKSSNHLEKTEAVKSFLKIFELQSLLSPFIKNGSVNKSEAFIKRINLLANSIIKMDEAIFGKENKIGALAHIVNFNKKKANLDEDGFDSELAFRESIIKEIMDTPAITAADGFIGQIQELLKVNMDINQIASIKDLNGKKLPSLIPTAFGKEIFKDLFRKLSKNGESRYLNHPFFSKNIYISKLVSIKEATGKHANLRDGEYVSGAGGNSFVQRMQVLMNSSFLSGIANGDYYYQPYFQQGEAIKSDMPRVGFLNFNTIHKSLDQMLQQLLDIDPSLEALKGYNTKERINFKIYEDAKLKISHEREGLKNPELREELVNEMMRILYKKTIPIVHRLKNLNIPLTEEAKKAYEKIYGDINSLGKVFGDVVSIDESEIDGSETTSLGNVKSDKMLFDINDANIHPSVFNKTSLSDGTPQSVSYPDDNILNLLVFSFVANQYVNSYALSQIVYGDFNVYGTIQNLVKRAQMSASPGYYPLIDAEFGIPRYAKILVSPDVITPGSEYEELLKKYSSFDNKATSSIDIHITKDKIDQIVKQIADIERTDGVMFMTPKYFYKLQKSFGSGLNLKNVLKDQAFGWTEQNIATGEIFDTLDELKANLNLKRVIKGTDYEVTPDGKFEKLRISLSPIGLKNAMIVLTDEFLNGSANRKDLADLRDLIDNEGLDMLAFSSANKIGNPRSLYKVFNPAGQFDISDNEDISKSTIKVDMSLFKIQYNPHSTSKTTALPRQITFFANAMNENKGIATRMYQNLAHLENLLYEDKFGSSVLTKEDFKRKIYSAVKRGDEHFAIRNALDADIPLDHPAIAGLAITALGSAMNKAVSQIRLKGGKLVLQSDIGMTVRDGKGGRRKIEHGVTETGTPYVEAIIPKHFLSNSHIKALDAGNSLFSFPELFGFRIPSGELNAGILIKIVEYYEVEGNSNIIVLPDLEILKQGWDFDVDSLFIIMMEDAKNDFTFKNEKGQVIKEIKKDTPIGFVKDSKGLYKSDKDNLELIIINETNRQQKLLDAHNNTLDSLKSAVISDTATDQEKSLRDTRIDEEIKRGKDIKQNIKNLKELRITLIKNAITQTYIDLFSNPSNNKRIMDITSTEVLDKEIDYLTNLGLYKGDNIDDLSMVDQNIEYYQRVNEAANGIGIYAKGSNVNACLGIERDRPAVKIVNRISDETLSPLFIYNGTIVSSLTARTTVTDTANKKTIETDSFTLNNKLLNAFLDAIKNPKIFTLGLSGANANLIDTALSMSGISFDDIILIFNHPVVQQLFKDKKFKAFMEEIGLEASVFKHRYNFLEITSKDIIDAYKHSYEDLEGLFSDNTEDGENIGTDEDIQTEDTDKTDDGTKQIEFDNKLKFAENFKNLAQTEAVFTTNNYVRLINQAFMDSNTLIESKKLYRVLSNTYHPDKRGEDIGTDEKEKAFKFLNNTYTDVLKNKKPYSIDQGLDEELEDDGGNVGDGTKKQESPKENFEMAQTPPFTKMMYMLHKIYKISEMKQLFIPLVNIAADKPTTIRDIFKFERQMEKLFKPEFIRQLRKITHDMHDPQKTMQENIMSISDKILKIQENMRYSAANMYDIRGGSTKETKLKNKTRTSDDWNESEEWIRGDIFNTDVLIATKNFLRKNMHLAIALLQTYNLIDNVKKEFVIFSEKAEEVAKSFLPIKDIKSSDPADALAMSFLTLSDMLISSTVSSINNTPSFVSFKKDKTYSGIQAFTRRLISRLQAIEKLEGELMLAKPGFKRNIFLEHIFVQETVPLTIKASEAFSIQDFNNADYFSAFMDLARYSFVEELDNKGRFIGYTAKLNMEQTESIIQDELVKYATFKYGLRPAANNFVNMIDHTFLKSKTKNITDIYDTYIKNNGSIESLIPIFQIYGSIKYPKSAPKLHKNAKYADKGRLLDTLDKIIAEYGFDASVKDLFFNEAVVSGSKGVLPLLYSRGNRKKPSTMKYYVLSDYVVSPNLGTIKVPKAYKLGLYKRFAYGEITMPNSHYNPAIHFRVDKQSIPIFAGTVKNLNSTTAIDENGVEVPNTFSIPYDEKFHANIINLGEVYAYDANDTLRLKLALLEITNAKTAVEDKAIKFTVIDGDVNINDHTDSRTQKEVNKDVTNQFRESLKDIKVYTEEGYIDLDKVPIGDNDIFVYMTNIQNNPLNKQSRLAFFSDPNRELKGRNVVLQRDYTVDGVINDIATGNKGKSFPLNTYSLIGKGSNLTEVSESMETLEQSISTLFLKANDNPELTFKLSVPKEMHENMSIAFLRVGNRLGVIPTNIMVNVGFSGRVVSNRYNFSTDIEEHTDNTPEPINIEKLIFNPEVIKQAEEIEKNCKGTGGLTAKNGLAIGFTPGSKWTLVKDLKGPSHAQGGIDLSIDKGKVMFSSGGSIYHAANGLVIQGSNQISYPPEKYNKLKSRKNNVITLQKKLKSNGYYAGNIDGDYGPLTEKAHIAYNESSNKVLSSLSPFPILGSAGRVAGQLLGVPLNIRTLGADLLGSNMDITENSLNDSEYNSLQSIVRSNLKKGKKTIDYSDYNTTSNPIDDVGANYTGWMQTLKKEFDPLYNLKTTLGRANIVVNGKDTSVVDQYNFNNKDLDNLEDVVRNNKLDPYSIVRGIGTLAGSGPGQGSKVNINTSKKRKKNMLDDHWDLITD